MAELKEYKLATWEQEEIIEKNLVAGEDGIVTEVITVIQPYVKATTRLVFSQTLLNNENRSYIEAAIWLDVEMGENGEPFTIDHKSGDYFSPLRGTEIAIKDGDNYYYNNYGGSSSVFDDIEVEPNDTISKKIGFFKVTYSDIAYAANSSVIERDLEDVRAIHDFNGNFAGFQEKGSSKIAFSNLFFVGKVSVKANNLLIDGEYQNINLFDKSFEYDLNSYILPTDRSTQIATASNFNDEENASITYKAEPQHYYLYNEEFDDVVDEVTALQVAFSFDGATIDIPYKDVPVDSTSYTVTFSNDERETMRIKAQGSDTVPIYYILKTTRKSQSGTTKDFINIAQRNLTIVGCNPTLNPTVKDIKEETLALTGDENTFIRYESMAEYAINATASKHATIVSQSVTCGSKTISNLPYGVIDDTEDSTFIFYVSDSRGMAAQSSVFKNLVPYVKPTCYQKVEIELSGETGANIKVTINGSYYNGSFGAANNTLLLEVRHTDDNGDMGEWKTITGTPTFNGNTYELEATFSGFDYGEAYIFQCRATDKLNTVQSSQYTIRLLPVFDWSETDFNFNVPVNIEANELNMSNDTVLRYNNISKRTILSGAGGAIYVRPNGTDSESGQMIINPDGSVSFSGNVDLGNSFTLNGNTLADYIIETGEEAMGSNGTWYWAKWASGKSECWGCRNFGNTAVTTSWGGLYRSAIFSQSLPDNVFKTTPDVININIVNSNFGGWICKHENAAPSAVTTGSFIFVRPASATVSPLYIGFHVIGVWKQ